jgi:UPF0755 protein
MRKLIKLVVLAVIAAGVWFAYTLLSAYGATTEKFVMLRPGSSVRQIAAQLKAEGIIRNETVFLALHALRGRGSLKAGEYRFDRPASALTVYERLARGDIYVHTVVIPEGYNIFEIGAALEGAGLASKDGFLNVARTETSLIEDMDARATSLEGYLFPDTYHFTRTQNAREMAAAMVRRFREEAKAIGLNADVHRVVTLASIVEKETGAGDERAVVASVYVNRMKKNMALAADPTVVYAALLANRYRGAIHQSDLAFDSPYNTYRRSGLPPGPIANPGRASLAAALRPAPTDYLYFVSDAQGRHRFARTYEEHLRNVAAYRRALASGP